MQAISVRAIELLAISALAAAAIAADAPGDWPGFRGSAGDGSWRQSTLLSEPGPVRFEVAWKKPLGSAYSGIAVRDGLAVTIFTDRKSDFVVALDTRDGSERWRFELGEMYKGHDGSHDGAISTPLIADGRVFALGPRGRFVALEAQTGKPIWDVNLVEAEKAQAPMYGFGCSPQLVGGTLILQVQTAEGCVMGLDPATGRRIWASGKDSVQWQSPIPWSRTGGQQVLAAGFGKLMGMDPKSGAVQWQFAIPPAEDRSAYSGIPVPLDDNRVFLPGSGQNSMLVKVNFSGETPEATLGWESKSIHNSYNPVVLHENHLYSYSSRFLTCVGADDGESKWRSRTPGDGFLILVDGHLVIATKSGGLYLAKASPEGYAERAALPALFREEDLAWTPPAFAEGSVFARSFGEIACVRIVSGAPMPPAAVKAVPDSGSRIAKLIQEVAAATDKKAVVDEFMNGITDFPLLDGQDTVHFLYRGPGSDLALAGDMFGARQERPMLRVPGTDLFYYTLQIEPDARLNYLFMRDYEEILDPRNPRKATVTALGKEMEIGFRGVPYEMSWFSMPRWVKPLFQEPAPEGQRGTLESKDIEIQSGKIKVELAVYLPKGYSRSEERYPVAYYLNGSEPLDEGGLVNALDNLIGVRCSPLIMVVVKKYNAPQRPFGPPPSLTAKDLAQELIPFVDNSYRTLAKPESRACLGNGFGGFSAFANAFGSEGLVNLVGVQSLFLMDMMKPQLMPLVPQAKDRPMKIYLEWGKYDLRNPFEAWDMGRASREFHDLLKEKGYEVLGGECNDGTDWPSWRNRLDRVLAALFPPAVMQVD